MKCKSYLAIFRMVLPAQKISPGTPKLGAMLSQRNIPVASFCSDFNSSTKSYTAGDMVTAEIIAYPNKKYEINVIGLSVPTMIKRELGIDSGSKKPGRENLQNVLSKQSVLKIAEVLFNRCKLYNTIEAACKSVMGTTKSMGILCAV